MAAFFNFKNMEIKTNKLYNENCLDTMARMKDNFIDLTVTSPPYDNLRTYNGYSFDFESIAKELYRVTKDGGVVVWIVADATIKGSETGTTFKQALYFKEIGFNLHDTMIWEKPTIPYDPKCNRYWNTFEYMFIFSKGKPICNYIKIPCKNAGKLKINDYGQKRIDGSIRTDRHKADRKIKDTKVKSNIWRYGIGKRQKGHPATFPEQLVNDHIISWSNKNDLVYDCFMGSGTTAKMAIVNKRKWIGSEMSGEYCDIIHERLKQFDNDIFLNTKHNGQ